jgi:hypothetical protein
VEDFAAIAASALLCSTLRIRASSSDFKTLLDKKVSMLR